MVHSLAYKTNRMIGKVVDMVVNMICMAYMGHTDHKEYKANKTNKVCNKKEVSNKLYMVDRKMDQLKSKETIHTTARDILTDKGYCKQVCNMLLMQILLLDLYRKIF